MTGVRFPMRSKALFAGGVEAFVVTPRAQNPMGAALDESRASELRRILRRHADVLLIEDDHAGSASGAPAISLTDAGLARWASVHSVSQTRGRICGSR
jgi:DNA-binding transcriptional MocR family regulator